THSTPEACALAIRTDAGTVLHTGDWKFEPNPVIGKPTDFDALERLGDEGVLAMIGDSTNVLSEKREGTEADVRESLIKLFSEYNGKIAAACFASNVARLESIAIAAKANGRCVSLVGRSLWRIEGAARAVGYLKGIDDFIEAEEARQLPDDKVVYICTGSQGEPRAALSRIAKNTHRFLRLGEGDVVIFSSRVIPGNEKSIFELQNNLYSLGVEIVTEQDRFIHVSGHPSREELEQLYKIIRPKISIPAHGEARHLIEHCLLAESLGVEKTEVIENGQMVCLSDDVCNHVDIIGEVKTGRLAIDGKNIVAYDSPALRARRKIIYNCSAVITIVIDSKCRIVGEPQLSVPGLIDSGTQKEELKAIIKEVRHSLKGMHKNKIKNDDSVSNVVRQAVRRSINNTFGKKPITDVHLVRI
ncbi:MAG: ribonuclease J, partial [Alphaproteobacteria bacterium]|nr:ribonuclease J [Alphaproteobacteria bacterium]